MWKISKLNDNKIYCSPFSSNVDEIYTPFLNYRKCDVIIEEIYPVGYFIEFYNPSVVDTKQIKLDGSEANFFKKLENKIFSPQEVKEIINFNNNIKTLFSTYLFTVKRKLLAHILR